MTLHSVNLDDLDAGPGTAVADILDEVRRTIRRYVILPSASAADAVALYAVATYSASEANAAPRLIVQSPEPRCGKTRLINDVLGNVVHKPFRALAPSPASIVHSIGTEHPPTLILDETDTIFTKAGDEKNELLRGVLNSGFNRGMPLPRWDPQARKLDECPTYAWAILAGINNGKMPDTILDRGVVITLRRKLPNESAERFRWRKDVPLLRDLGERIGDIIQPISGTLADAEPALPSELDDRAQDCWEPLIALADYAGPEWGERARRASIELSGGRDAAGDDSTRATSGRLLVDIKSIWPPHVTSMFSAEIAQELSALEDCPWKTYDHGQVITGLQMAVLLRPYGVHSKDIRRDGQVRKGYTREAFEDAWARYAPSPEEVPEDDETPPF